MSASPDSAAARNRRVKAPSFWRTLVMGRKATDAYGIAVFESKGWTREEALRGMAELRAAVRGVPHSPWFKRKWQDTPIEELLLNLTHCSECGLPFDDPVTAVEALRWFPNLDVASFACGSCSSEWGDE